MHSNYNGSNTKYISWMYHQRNFVLIIRYVWWLYNSSSWAIIMEHIMAMIYLTQLTITWEKFLNCTTQILSVFIGFVQSTVGLFGFFWMLWTLLFQNSRLGTEYCANLSYTYDKFFLKMLNLPNREIDCINCRSC